MEINNIVQEIKNRWRTLDTDELHRRCESGECTNEERTAVQELLAERGGDSQLGTQQIKSFAGKYRKVQVKPFKGYGMYRGGGRIEFTDDSLRICGRHVMSLGARWGIGLCIFFGTLMVSAGTFAPGFVLIYLIMEYVWLKTEDTVVPYSNITRYVEIPKKSLVGIYYQGSQWCNPVFLKSDKGSEILAQLRKIIPDRDASLTEVPPLPKGRAIALSSLVFIGYYFLFSICVMLVVGLMLTSLSVDGIPGIQNGIIRKVTWLIVVSVPIVASIIFSKKYYRKKRTATTINISGVSSVALIFVACLFIPAILAAMLLPALSLAREKARRAQCMNNEKQIGRAIAQYAGAYEDRLPISVDDLKVYVGGSSKVFICPSAADQTRPSYILTGATNIWEADPNIIILREEPTDHRGAGGNVLFDDGHVEWQSSQGQR